MRRLLFGVLLVGLLAPRVYAACTDQALYQYVQTEWWDGRITGHWEFYGWATVCEGGGGGGGGGYQTGPGRGGGGALLPQDKIDQRQAYTDAGCTEPAYSQFLDEDGYAASGMGNWMPWEDYRYGTEPYVLVDPNLAAGITSIATCMDNQLPRNADPGNGGGYRMPGTNANTPCGKHAYGQAVDLSIRAMDQYGNNTGEHDCQLWNALAGCANAAGGWVEPWSMIKASNVLHFHVSFGQPPNSPAEYGDACANP
ncbi:MAG: hypothetical protein M3Q69_02670 [Acidobacteriota bacterium]|nr:hypothetical protein [Acidobacteriota bacterium]